MRKLFALLFVPALMLASCGDDDSAGLIEENPSLVDAAEDAGLTILLDAITAVDGLSGSLTAATEITVFAPNNAAFAAALNAYGVTTLDQLVAELGGADNLESVLGFHVVGATAFAADLAEGDQPLTTLSGQSILVNKTGSDVTVTDALGNTRNVVAADVAIENGVVHVIDGVLLPEIVFPSVVDAASAAGLTTLLDAVTAADLGTTLTSAEAITVFAPTNDAFGGLLERYDATDLNDLVSKIGIEAVTEVLQFHVVPAVAFSHDLNEGEQTFSTLQGQDLTVTVDDNGVTVTDYLGFTYTVNSADVAIANGVVHVIDGVVLPDLSDDPNVVEAATTAGLTTLIDAVVAAELGDALIQATDITVFAPTNDAFVDLLEAQEVEDLEGLITKLGAANVVKVLQFHVVPAVAFSGDLAEGDQMFETLAGEMITVNKTGMAVTVTDAGGNTYNVSTPDVTIENGVVHVIDGVVLPTL
ncbi:fasciclin domain-containing protein [Ekhidna sp. To15]|uniref:fasciclin domain-containing protein n=1 Tax=Ekhidna sp. To15 TaxID=3395267 RepID=UPI003F51B645